MKMDLLLYEKWFPVPPAPIVSTVVGWKCCGMCKGHFLPHFFLCFLNGFGNDLEMGWSGNGVIDVWSKCANKKCKLLLKTKRIVFLGKGGRKKKLYIYVFLCKRRGDSLERNLKVEKKIHGAFRHYESKLIY